MPDAIAFLFEKSADLIPLDRSVALFQERVTKDLAELLELLQNFLGAQDILLVFRSGDRGVQRTMRISVIANDVSCFTPESQQVLAALFAVDHPAHDEQRRLCPVRAQHIENCPVTIFGS